ncbi:MAG TPA: hypothetical protein DC046_17690, partial [Rhodospirillaceae bacterium]|nr:hypothetical protein [Rhodospirillaceae bacterium]
MTQPGTTPSYTTETQAPAQGQPALVVLEDGTASAGEGRRRLWSRGMIAGLVVLVAAVGIWAAFAEVQETVEAEGAVVPAGQVRAV